MHHSRDEQFSLPEAATGLTPGASEAETYPQWSAWALCLALEESASEGRGAPFCRAVERAPPSQKLPLCPIQLTDG